MCSEGSILFPGFHLAMRSRDELTCKRSQFVSELIATSSNSHLYRLCWVAHMNSKQNCLVVTNDTRHLPFIRFELSD